MVDKFNAALSTNVGSPGQLAEISYGTLQKLIDSFASAKASISQVTAVASQGLNIKENYNCTILKS